MTERFVYTGSPTPPPCNCEEEPGDVVVVGDEIHHTCLRCFRSVMIIPRQRELPWYRRVRDEVRRQRRRALLFLLCFFFIGFVTAAAVMAALIYLYGNPNHAAPPVER